MEEKEVSMITIERAIGDRVLTMYSSEKSSDELGIVADAIIDLVENHGIPLMMAISQQYTDGVLIDIKDASKYKLANNG